MAIKHMDDWLAEYVLCFGSEQLFCFGLLEGEDTFFIRFDTWARRNRTRADVAPYYDYILSSPYSRGWSILKKYYKHVKELQE